MCRISSRNAPIWTNVESLYNKLVKYNTHAHTQHQQNTNVASTKLTRETKQNTHDNTNQCIRYILADWSQHDSKMWPVLHVCSISQSSFPKAAFTPDTFSWIQVCRTSNLYPSTGWWIQVLSSVLLADTSGYMSPWRQFCRRYGIQTATRDTSGYNLYPGYMYQVQNAALLQAIHRGDSLA